MGSLFKVSISSMSLRASAHTGVAIRFPMAPPMGELSAKLTALSAPSGHLSQRERLWAADCHGCFAASQ